MEDLKFVVVVLAISSALFFLMPRAESQKCAGAVETLFWNCTR